MIQDTCENKIFWFLQKALQQLIKKPPNKFLFSCRTLFIHLHIFSLKFSPLR